MNDIESLEEAACLELLGQASLGRLGVVINEYPMIYPVNYALDGDRVTFRSAPDTKFNAAHYANVCFEADCADVLAHEGWSVVVLGSVEVVDTTVPSELERMERLGVSPFAPGDRTLWVQVVPKRISGRRIRSTQSTFGLDHHGYPQ